MLISNRLSLALSDSPHHSLQLEVSQGGGGQVHLGQPHHGLAEKLARDGGQISPGEIQPSQLEVLEATEEVAELRSRKGHALLFHGGGCSPFAQVNDTRLRAMLARHLIDLENVANAVWFQRLL